MCVCVYVQSSDVLYLQISVYDACLVKVADCLQHLSDDITGVLLCVHAPVYDPVEQLSPGHPVEQSEWDRGILHSCEHHHCTARA